MNSRNGISKEFRVSVKDKITGVETYYTFSFKHQALEEWVREKWLYDTIIDGSDTQELKYLHYFFRIDWTELIVGADADLLKEIRNAEYRGDTIFITPHIDVPGREFEVFSLKDSNGNSDDIKFAQIINHRNSPGNRGTVMIYKTVRPYYSWEITDPSNQQGVSTIGMEEFS